jgi:transcriptional regulator with XRE-family HTH domain
MVEKNKYTASEGLGDLLMRERITRNLSRAKLAEMAGVNANSLAKWEKAGLPDGKYPPLPKLSRLCQILEIDPRHVFNLVYMQEEQKRVALPFGEDHGELGERLSYDGDDAFNFVSYFQGKKEGYALEYIISKLQMNEYEMGQLFDGINRIEKALGISEKSKSKENGSDHKDPSRPSQNTPKAVDAAPNHPKRKDDQT